MNGGNLQTHRLSGPKAAPASFIKCRLSIARCFEMPNETRNKPRAESIANSLTLSRQGGRWFISWLGAVRHNGINRCKGRSTDTLIVVVFGRIGGERGGAERNPSADYGNGGGQVGKGEADVDGGPAKVDGVAEGRVQHADGRSGDSRGYPCGDQARLTRRPKVPFPGSDLLSSQHWPPQQKRRRRWMEVPSAMLEKWLLPRQADILARSSQATASTHPSSGRGPCHPGSPTWYLWRVAVAVGSNQKCRFTWFERVLLMEAFTAPFTTSVTR